MDYGYRKGQWMGICHGQWVREDVVPLFAREGIEVDFSKRGFLDPNQRPASLNRSASREDRYRRVYNCLAGGICCPISCFAVAATCILRFTTARWMRTTSTICSARRTCATKRENSACLHRWCAEHPL